MIPSLTTIGPVHPRPTPCPTSCTSSAARRSCGTTLTAWSATTRRGPTCSRTGRRPCSSPTATGTLAAPSPRGWARTTPSRRWARRRGSCRLPTRVRLSSGARICWNGIGRSLPGRISGRGLRRAVPAPGLGRVRVHCLFERQQYFTIDETTK